MKKYLLTILLALITGFFLCKFFLNQYSDFNGISVSSTADDVYFIQYGVYSSIDSVEEHTINLQNYIYSIYDDLYYVYVGITKNSDNASKIVNYFKNKGSDTIIKTYSISNTKFINILKTYDEVLTETDDNTVISSIISQVLDKYEEVVINGEN